ncbi:MAG: glycosyl transferase family 2, partial [Deltaproteobacteria bacterium]
KFNTKSVTVARGRGRQMNAAVKKADSDFLLFLHADSKIDDQLLLCKAVQALHGAIATAGSNNIAGHFRLKFIRTKAQNAMAYRNAEEKSALNRPNTTNGDQGLLLSKNFFWSLGGFDESLPFLEDQRIAEKIRSCGEWITLPGCILTSARRLEREGFHRRYILISMLMGLYSIGELTFFDRAPGVYKAQHETGRLMLSPFFEIIRLMMRCEWGMVGTFRVFYSLGRYVRQNSWQMFFFFDIWARPILGPERYPFMKFHDRFIAPLINLSVFNAFTGILCFIWFMGILAPFFRLQEYRKIKAMDRISYE